jgi:hypothetical protein
MVPALRPEARATVLGTIGVCDEPAIARRYLRFFPDNRDFLDIGGFRFYVIEPEHARLIAGFGSAHWVNGKSLLAPELPIAQAEDSIIEHMNTDHRDSLLECCRHVHGIQAATVEMVGIDCDGFDVRADDMLYRFDFDSQVSTATGARGALVALARTARN